jgi:hypothetical protein
MWNSDLKWFFPDGTADGYNDPGISEFRSTGYDGLAREIIQNSLDAKDESKNEAVRVVFEKIKLEKSCFPNYKDFLSRVELCMEYNEGEKKAYEKLRKLKVMLEAVEKNPTFNVLKISDYNTNGLKGINTRKDTSWANLIRRSQSSGKKDGDGGSFGIGKFAPFVFSNIRTIIYSTKNTDGELGVQGKTILAGHIYDDSEKGTTGLFGMPSEHNLGAKKHDDVSTIINYNHIPEVFIRKEFGTSLFVLIARFEDCWMESILESVVYSFFFAIYFNELVVEIVDGEKKYLVDKNNLSEVIEFLISNNSNKRILITKDYVKLLNNWNSCEVSEQEFNLTMNNKKSIGKMEIRVLSDKNIQSKSIAHIRKTGMKIEDKNYNSLMGYIGISRTINEEMNTFLRECEAPKHDEWNSNNFELYLESDKNPAKSVLSEVTNWERDVISKLTKIDTKQKLDPLGMEEFLPSDLGDEEGKSDDQLSYKPLQKDIRMKKDNKRMYVDSDTIDGVIPDDNGDIPIEEQEGRNEGTGGRNNVPGGSDGGFGVKGPTDSNDTKKISIKQVNTPYLNIPGHYRITFIPEIDQQNCELNIRRVGDDLFESLKIKELYLIEGNQKKRINSFDVENSKKMIFEVSLENVDRVALEVTCVAKK